MSLINKTVLLTKGLRSEFISAFVNAPRVMPDLATIVNSTASSEDYAWLGETPAMREFLDERQVKGFSDTQYAIANKTWEATMGVKRSELEDDQTTAIQTRIRDLGGRAAQHPDELLFETIENGTSATLGLGYDGVSFYNDAHPARGEQTATQDNLLAGTGVTTAAFKTDIQSAITALKDFVDERDKPFNTMLDSANLIAVVPTGIEFNFKEALNATIIANTSNIMVGAVGRVIVSPWLTDADDWYLLWTGSPLRPFIFQDRMGVEFQAMEAESEAGFFREQYFYGVRARYNLGYGFWQMTVKTVN